MNFKKFIEDKDDVQDTLNLIPKKHLKLLDGLIIKYTCNNTLNFDNKSIGMLKNNKITVSAPWHYSRQFTTLHEIAHIIWCKYLSDKQKETWKKIFLEEKNKIKHPSIKQNHEEIFCMAYANYYCKHKLQTYSNKKWEKFIKKI